MKTLKQLFITCSLQIVFCPLVGHCQSETDTIKTEVKIQTDTVSYEHKMAQVKKVISTIKAGTTREEIEKIFPKMDGGILSSSNTRYYEHPYVMIEIPFDDTRGVWNKMNKVNGIIKVYKSSAHIR